MQCINLTKNGTQCKRKSAAESKCCSQHQRTTECSVCFEVIFQDSKSLTCKHAFHKKCILPWFVEQDTCPVCRTAQPNDEFVKFRDMVGDNMRDRYKDAIQSLEEEVRLQQRHIAGLTRSLLIE